MADHPPTPQQQAAIDLFLEGGSLVIEAGAGTGKTSTLRLLAAAAAPRKGQYVAFNRAIVDDASAAFGGNVNCQPDGSMVLVPGGEGNPPREVPIESLYDHQRVVSVSGSHGPVIRKRGRAITVTRRFYDGPLVTATAAGRSSRYTPEHPCIVSIRHAFEAKHLVYLMRRQGYYKIGMCVWRLSGGRNGLQLRLRQEGADAVWILSAHDSRGAALEAEALAQYHYRIPGWRFRDVRGLPIETFWSQVTRNRPEAEACLSGFGRLIEHPLWETGRSMRFGQQTLVIAAANLMTGMSVLVVAGGIEAFGRVSAPQRVWTPITVSTEAYWGTVTSLEVADDHTYFADGILTHNCATAHSLAFRAVGRDFGERLRSSGRLRSNQLARILELERVVVDVPDTGRKFLAPGFLAGLVLRGVTRFCQSADPEIAGHHLPYIRGIDAPVLAVDGRPVPGMANNREVRRHLEPVLQGAWADFTDPAGRLPYRHDHYLKLWELNDPVIGAEFIMFDEAQDASPVLLSAVTKQAHAQLILVGDSNQAIYQFTGAIDALESVQVDHRSYLTRSFRFGPAIATLANRILADLPTVLQLEGSPDIASTVAPVAYPDAVLCRTNATAVRKVIAAHATDTRVCLVGGGADVIAFAKAARDLQARRPTEHPDLACFTTWGEVVTYVNEDEQGDELRLLVNLVEEFGVTEILTALELAVTEDQAELIVSTAHKAKGREWAAVQLAGDFSDDPDPDELRLLYVAVTRARRELDVTLVPILDDAPERDPHPDTTQLELEDATDG